MSNRVHLVIPDPHAIYNRHNKRAEWLGRLIADVKPDVVVNLGDNADMPSLASYDKGKKSFQGRTYRADVDAHLDFNDRLWHEVKKHKKKMPHRVFLEGNHERRITTAIELQPELEGVITLDDLEIGRYYDEFVPYDGTTPGTVCIDGINYSHFAISGVLGRPVSGEHPAYSLLTKRFISSTVGHTHTLDYCVRTAGDGRKVSGLVSGCFFDYDSEWAGNSNSLYWRGVIVKRRVEGGVYDPQFISLDYLKKHYA